MNIEEIIRAWKAEKREERGQRLPENPVGNELSDEELEEALGGQHAAEYDSWGHCWTQTYCYENCKP